MSENGAKPTKTQRKRKKPNLPCLALSCACLSCWRALLWSFAVELCFGACFSCNSPETPTVCVLRVGCVRKMCVDKDTVGQIVTGENNHLSSFIPSTLTYLFFFLFRSISISIGGMSMATVDASMHTQVQKKTRHIFCSEWLAPLFFFFWSALLLFVE